MNFKNNNHYYLKKQRKLKINILLSVIIVASFTIALTGCNSNSTTSNVANIEKNFETTFGTTFDSASESMEETTSVTSVTLPTKSSSKNLSVSCILQEPELPSGCEVTSLAIVLNYLGISTDKCDLADHYLVTAPIGTASLHTAFAGDTRDPYAYGCYSEVLVNTANQYLTNTGHSDMNVKNLSGNDFYSLFDELDHGYPVIIWGTEKMKPAGDTISWTTNGIECTWKYGQHCLVLTGYNYDNKTVTIADPLRGTCSYDMDTVAARYVEMYSQSIVIHNSSTLYLQQ